MKRLVFKFFIIPVSLLQNLLSIFHKPFMVYGFYNFVDKRFYKDTRVSSSSIILKRRNADIKGNVWVGHFSLIDASQSVTIEEGVQTGTHISIFTHSSHNSIRMYGKDYILEQERSFNLNGPVHIGKYTFIGTNAIIFPGVKIGMGSIIKAGAVVNKSFDDFSIIEGNPAKCIGSTRDLDRKLIGSHNEFPESYYLNDNF